MAAQGIILTDADIDKLQLKKAAPKILTDADIDALSAPKLSPAPAKVFSDTDIDKGINVRTTKAYPGRERFASDIYAPLGEIARFTPFSEEMGGELTDEDIDRIPKRAAFAPRKDETLGVASPEQIETWKKMEPIGYAETARRLDISERLPFSPERALKSVKLLAAVNRLKSGEYDEKPEITGNAIQDALARDAFEAQKLSDEAIRKEQGIKKQTPEEKKAGDIKLVKDYLLAKEEESIRGVTIAGQIVRGVSELPAYMVEFMATGGLAALGKKVVQKAAAKVLGEIAEKGIVKIGVKAAQWTAGGLARTLAMPHRVAERYVQRQVEGITTGEEDRIVETAMEEAPFTSAWKAFGDVVIENMSEEAGATLAKGVSKIAAGAGKVVPKKMAQALTKLFKKLHPGEKIEKLFTQAGYHGFLEEVGEERLGDFMRAVTNVDDFGAEDKDMFGRIAASIPSGEQMLVEAGVLTVPGIARVAAGKAAEVIKKKVTPVAEEPEVKPTEKVIKYRVEPDGREVPVVEITAPAEAPKAAQPVIDEANYKSIVEQQGAKYEGIFKGEEGVPGIVSFTDKKTGSTLALSPEEFTVENVKKKIEESRQVFEKAEIETIRTQIAEVVTKEGKITDDHPLIIKLKELQGRAEGIGKPTRRAEGEVQAPRGAKEPYLSDIDKEEQLLIQKAKTLDSRDKFYKYFRSGHSIEDVMNRATVITGKPREKLGVSKVTKLKGETQSSGFAPMPTSDEITNFYNKYHTKQALSEGKPVPAEVLKDYPDIKPALPAKAKPAPVEIITQETDILKKSGIPEADIPGYIRSSELDGEKLRAYTEDVITGKLTEDQAAQKVIDDYSKAFKEKPMPKILEIRINKLKELKAAKIDPISGLPTRRYMVELLESFLKVSEKTGIPTNLGFLDIDNFKQINDKYGHDEGDKVIKIIADSLRKHATSPGAGKSPLIGKAYGGDEYLWIFRGKKEIARQRLESALSLVRKDLIDAGYNNVNISGGFESRSEDGAMLHQMLKSAERKMADEKVIKKAGRPAEPAEVKPPAEPAPAQVITPALPGRTVNINPESIKTAPEELQLRDTPFAKETVDAILQSGWDDAQYAPIPVVARAGAYFVAGDGHSRLEGWRQLKEAGMPVPDALEFKVVTEAEAKRLKFANLKRTQLKPLEEMRAFAELIDKGKSIRDIANEFGISSTYVESILSLRNLSNEMQSLIRDKAFPIQHAFVLGRASGDYNIPAEVQSEIFHRFIKTQDPTVTQLKMFLDKIGNKVSEQLSLGLTGLEVSKGMGGVLQDVFDKIKEIEKATSKKELQAIIRAVDRLKKRKQPVPEGIAKEYDKIKKTVDTAEEEIKQLLKGIKLEKPEEPPLQISEKKTFYQQDIEGYWEKVTPEQQTPKTKVPEITLWTHLAKPKFDMPQSAAPKKAEPIPKPAVQEEIDFQVKQPSPPHILLDSQISLKLVEKSDMLLATSLSVNKPEDVVDIFYEMKNLDREHMKIIMLDRNNKILGVNTVSIGTVNASLVHPREVLKPVLLMKAKKIILIHNHPSKIVKPSEDDIKLTLRLRKAAEEQNIEIPYHIIIDHNEFGILLESGDFNSLQYVEPAKRPLKVKEVDVWADHKAKGYLSEYVIKKPMDALDLVLKHFSPKKDSLNILYLNAQNMPIAVELTGNETILKTPEMFAKKLQTGAINYNASSAMIVHNFSLQLPTDMVKNLSRKMDVLGIELLDVIQVTDLADGAVTDYHSMKAKNLIGEPRVRYVKGVAEPKPDYLTPSKTASDIEKLRARIGISSEQFAGIKLSIIGKQDLKDMDINELLRLKKVLQAMRAKVTIPKKEEAKAPEEQIQKAIVGMQRPEPSPISPEEWAVLDHLKGKIEALEKKHNLTRQEIDSIRLNVSGWTGIEGAKRGELYRLINAIYKHTDWKQLRQELDIKAKKIGLIKGKSNANLRRFIKNYFHKNPDQLTNAELLDAIKKIGELQINYKGTVTIPRVFKPLLFPQQKVLLQQHKVGIGKWVFEPYEYLKLFDIDDNIKNIKELTKLLREKQKTPAEIKQILHTVLPLEGNDLRYLDKFGLYAEIGKPLEQAGFAYRKLLNQYAGIVERWGNAAKETPEGKEIMFHAADGPFTKAIKEQLTDNQIKAIEEWFEWRDYFADKFKIEQPLNNYIHHLIEETMRIYIKEKYPFPEELAAIMEHIIPSQVYAGFLKERIGFPFIQRDFVAATGAYFRIAARKLAYDAALKEVIGKFRVMRLKNPQLVKHMEEFIQINLLGRQTEQAKLIANTANSITETFFKEKTVALPDEIRAQIFHANLDLPTEFQVPRFHVTASGVNRFISTVKMLNYLSVIALNARTTFINLTQVTLAVAKMHLPYTKRAWILAKTWAWAGIQIFKKSTWKKMEDQGILEEMQRFMETDKRANEMLQNFVGYSMINMKVTEFINRVTTAKLGIEQKRILAKGGRISAYELDRLIEKDPGFLKEAKQLDKEFSDVVNYMYGADYTPPLFMSPMGRIAYHLNSFGMKFGNRIVMFMKEVQLGTELKLLMKSMQQEGWTEDDTIKFVQGLPPQKRSNFVFLLMMLTALGIAFGSWTYFTLRAIGIGVNPILQMTLYLIAGEPDMAYKELIKTFIPFRSAYKRVVRITKEGIPGIWRTGKLVKEQTDEMGETAAEESELEEEGIE